MQSIPSMMSWEALRRGRLALVLCPCGAITLPVLVFFLLRLEGLNANDGSMHHFLYRYMLSNVILCAMSLIDFAGLRSWNYTLPISTAKLVTWRLIPAMLVVAIQSLFITSVENAIFGIDFPLWGPALFAATAGAAGWATYWSTKDSIWHPIGIIVVEGLLGCWYFVRFSAMTEQPYVPLRDLPIQDFVGLGIVAVVSYFVAIEGVARIRCGDSLSTKLSHYLFGHIFSGHFFHDDRADARRFRTPMAAQYWFEWRNKGMVMPGIATFAILVGLTAWRIQNLSARELIAGFVESLAGFSMIIGVAGGIAVGEYRFGFNRKGESLDLEIGHFAASRPMTNTNYACTLLKLLIRSATLAWAIWAVSFFLVWGIATYFSGDPRSLDPKNIRWWFIPTALLGMWTIGAAMASLMLSGEKKRISQFGLTLFVGVLLVMIFTKFLRSREAAELIAHVSAALCGVGFAAGSAGLFAVAKRKNLIDNSTIVKCSVAWLSLCTPVVFECVRNPNDSAFLYVLAIGIAALAVVPFASTPLAIAHNRCR